MGEAENLFDGLVGTFGLAVGLGPVGGGHLVLDVQL